MTDRPLAAAPPAAQDHQATQHVQDAQPVQDRRPSAPRAQSAEVLAVDGVTVRLAGREVLKDVTFSLRRGGFAGLIGSNGAGKTTLLRAILGLTQPSAGEVRIDGRVASRHTKAKGGAIGYVPQ